MKQRGVLQETQEKIFEEHLEHHTKKIKDRDEYFN